MGGRKWVTKIVGVKEGVAEHDGRYSVASPWVRLARSSIHVDSAERG